MDPKKLNTQSDPKSFGSFETKKIPLDEKILKYKQVRVDWDQNTIDEYTEAIADPHKPSEQSVGDPSDEKPSPTNLTKTSQPQAPTPPLANDLHKALRMAVSLKEFIEKYLKEEPLKSISPSMKMELSNLERLIGTYLELVPLEKEEEQVSPPPPASFTSATAEKGK